MLRSIIFSVESAYFLMESVEIFVESQVSWIFDANISHFQRILTLFPTLQRAWLAGGVFLLCSIFQTQR